MPIWIESPDIEMMDCLENEGSNRMKPADFIREHIRLIKVLTKGTKKEQKKEATDQAKELKKMLMTYKK